jgi:hypothetical protein
METHELFNQEQLGETLAKAKNITQVYQRPGQQGQRGHGSPAAAR